MSLRLKNPGDIRDAPISPQTSDTVQKSEMPNADDPWHTLITWDDLEHWRQDNHWIHGSYRKTANSYFRSYASIFQIHNETVNIWSHMIPALLSIPVAYLFYFTLESRYERAS